MNSILLVLLLTSISSLTISKADVSCDKGFQLVDSKYCFLDAGPVSSFCAANAVCAEKGKEIDKHVVLVGDHYLSAAKLKLSSRLMWTSLTNFYIPKGEPKTTWMDANPNGLIYAVNNLSKIEDVYEKTQNVEPIFVYDLQDKVLRDYGHNYNHHVVCEIMVDFPEGSFNSNELTNIHFSKTTLPKSFNQLSKAPELDGCVELTQTNDEQECGLMCVEEEYCRMLHYNNETGDCVLVKYIPSLIPSKYSSAEGSWSTAERLYAIDKSII